MKCRAVVIDIIDPKNLGRIRVEIEGAHTNRNATPWVYPCTSLAGPGFGFYCLPVIGDQVWIERTADNEWVYTGFCWTTDNPIPSDSGENVRLFRTPAGHQLKFDDSGSIEVLHSGGSVINLTKDGNIKITAAGDIELNGTDSKVITTKCICAFTGNPHPQGSTTVKAKGL
jgi:hypothetical protein